MSAAEASAVTVFASLDVCLSCYWVNFGRAPRCLHKVRMTQRPFAEAEHMFMFETSPKKWIKVLFLSWFIYSIFNVIVAVNSSKSMQIGFAQKRWEFVSILLMLDFILLGWIEPSLASGKFLFLGHILPVEHSKADLQWCSCRRSFHYVRMGTCKFFVDSGHSPEKGSMKGVQNNGT